MAGLFGLFGGRKQESKPQDAYFLSPDEAKTLGNIDYMRTPRTIKKTFPKTATSSGGEVVYRVSSLDMKPVNVNESSAPRETSSSTTNGFSSSFSPSTRENKNTDTTMDMFREMAKQIRKPKA